MIYSCALSEKNRVLSMGAGHAFSHTVRAICSLTLHNASMIVIYVQ